MAPGRHLQCTALLNITMHSLQLITKHWIIICKTLSKYKYESKFSVTPRWSKQVSENAQFLDPGKNPAFGCCCSFNCPQTVGARRLSTAVKTIHGLLKAQWSFQLPHYIEMTGSNCHLPMCFAILQWTQVHKLIFCSSEFASVLLATTYLPILPMCESAICNVIFLQQSVFAICCCTRHLQQTCCCAACTPHSLVSFSHFLICVWFSHLSITSAFNSN